MKTHVPKAIENQTPASAGKQTATQAAADGFADLRPAAAAQRRLAEATNASPRMLAQRKQLNSLFGPTVQMQAAPEAKADASPAASATSAMADSAGGGLPPQLRAGIESLSGMSMRHVSVHYNSSRPAQLNALAYAQGSEIHVAPGQQRHLPHEAWHVVQQAQGRVKPTRQMKQGVAINDDKGLEHEADVMGAKATSLGGDAGAGFMPAAGPAPMRNGPAQRIIVSGADSNPQSAAAVDRGIEAQISPMEVQLQLDIFTGRHHGMRSYTLPNLEAAVAKNTPIDYDDVNYMVGHAEDARDFMGRSAGVMAALLKGSGLKSGMHVMLIACNGAWFAGQLHEALAKLDVHVAVTGALGLVYGHAAASGRDDEAVEAVFDDQQDHVRDRVPGDKIKYDLARQYDNRMLNEIIGLGVQLLDMARADGGSVEFKKLLGELGFNLFKQLSSLQVHSTILKPVAVPKPKKGGAAVAAASAMPAAAAAAKEEEPPPKAFIGSAELAKFITSLKSGGADKQAANLVAAVEKLKIMLAGVWRSSTKMKYAKGNYPFASIYVKLSEIQQALQASQSPPAVAARAAQGNYHAFGRLAADQYIRGLMQHLSKAPKAVMRQGWKTYLAGRQEFSLHGRWRDAAPPLAVPRAMGMAGMGMGMGNPMLAAGAAAAAAAPHHGAGALVPYQGGAGAPALYRGGGQGARHQQGPRIVHAPGGWQMLLGISITDHFFHTIVNTVQTSLPPGSSAEFIAHYRNGGSSAVHVQAIRRRQGRAAPLMLGAPPVPAGAAQALVPAREIVTFGMRVTLNGPGIAGAAGNQPAAGAGALVVHH